MRSVCCWLVHPWSFVQVAAFWMCRICTGLCAFFLLFCVFVQFDWVRIPTQSLHVCCRSGTHGGAFPPARSPARPGCSCAAPTNAPLTNLVAANLLFYFWSLAQLHIFLGSHDWKNWRWVTHWSAFLPPSHRMPMSCHRQFSAVFFVTKPRVGQQEIRAEPRQQEQMHP